MNPSKYIIRFDDICPAMNWDKWKKIEAILVENNIKPILAVIPNNLDSSLNVMQPKDDFWLHVKRWQEMGWTIGLHGYEHLYNNSDPGLIGLNKSSEFAGLSRDIQKSKLIKALNIFRNHGIKADIWVAPGHSYDSITVSVLLELGLRVISDGFYLRPVKYMGAIHIPQQIWQFRKFPIGIWTVCFHINTMDEAAIAIFASSTALLKDQISSVLEVLSFEESIKNPTIFDTLFSKAWLYFVRFKKSFL